MTLVGMIITKTAISYGKYSMRFALVSQGNGLDLITVGEAIMRLARGNELDFVIANVRLESVVADGF
jgi:hypothetical protein